MSEDKTKYEYHIVTGTDAGFMCDTIVSPFIRLIVCIVIILFLLEVILIGRIAKNKLSHYVYLSSCNWGRGRLVV